jgi:Peptidase family M28
MVTISGGRRHGVLVFLLAISAGAARAQTVDGETTRLMARLSALSADSMEGRRAGTPGSRRARRWIVSQLAAIGAAPLAATFEQPITLPARAGADTLGANIIARIPGTRSGGPAIIVSAHYDHLGVRDGVVFNGADDDASGCVALLAIAERLVKERPAHDVILAFFDNEEGGMHGSRGFVASGLVAADRIALNINLDMIARQDGKALWVSGTSHHPMLKPLAEAAQVGATVPIRFGHDTKDLKPGDDWTNSSDHAAFHARGIPFLYLGVEDHPDYHKAGDDADKVDPAFYRGTVDFAYRLVREADRRADAMPKRPAGPDSGARDRR